MYSKQRIGSTLTAVAIGYSRRVGLHIFQPYSAQAATTIHYVAPEAQGSGNCDQWENACLLTTALNQASEGEEIWVMQGIHYPAQTEEEREATFRLLSNVAVYGGFDGSEEHLTQRDFRANRTVLSADIDRNDELYDDLFVANAKQIEGSNSYHVVYAEEVNEKTILDGFIITAGTADGDTTDQQNGGGIVILGENPTLRNLTFSGNFATLSGGGMYLENTLRTSHLYFSGTSPQTVPASPITQETYFLAMPYSTTTEAQVVVAQYLIMEGTLS